MSICLLDRLPVELVHEIFIYLSAHEIIYAFSNVTDYFNKILISYDRYLVNFRSVLKCHFDVTCRFIRPDQIISLVLSDDDDTPDQSELFFSYFKIDQFTRLRLFDMSLMNSDTFKKLNKLHQLKELKSLDLPHLFEPYHQEIYIIIKNILPRLNRLMAYNTNHLLNISLPDLYHLNLKYCSCHQLVTLFTMIPNLQTLDITLTCGIGSNWSNNIPLLTHLKTLILNTYGEKILMRQMKELLSKTPNLKHFQLNTEGSDDLVDGQQWEPIVLNLSVFDFRIRFFNSFHHISEETILQSFRSIFWLEQKRWFVAYDDSDTREIFTIPRFLSTIVKYPYTNWPLDSTLPEFSCDQHIKYLHCSVFNSIPHRFMNITSLNMDTNRILNDIEINTLIHLIEQMKYLHSISFRNLYILKKFPRNITFEKIRSLSVQEYDQLENIPNRLCTIFPRLERLKTKLLPYNELFLLIDQLKHLSIAQFEFRHPSSRSFKINHNWLVKNSVRLRTNQNFTFRFFNDTIYLWMSNENISNNESMSVWFSLQSCTLQ
ncbi:hypothetical protein I4U23_004063 [Adineta vaga]|nr:hypothetical protein I4U23_004063 [Adineta vaga]